MAIQYSGCFQTLCSHFLRLIVHFFFLIKLTKYFGHNGKDGYIVCEGVKRRKSSLSVNFKVKAEHYKQIV